MLRRSGVQLFRAAVVICVPSLAVATVTWAGTFTAFGPQNYTRDSGAPITVTNTFSVLNPNTQYTLKAFNRWGNWLGLEMAFRR